MPSRCDFQSVVIIDPSYNWSLVSLDGIRLWFNGFIWQGDRFLTGKQAGRAIHESLLKQRLLSTDNAHQPAIKNFLRNLRGNCSCIIKTSYFVLGWVDKLRSYPIFYHFQDNGFLISNSARKIKDTGQLVHKDAVSLLEFRMAGYVTGRDTLYEGLHQLQAGEYLFFIEETQQLAVDKYYQYFCEEIDVKNEKDLIEEYDAVSHRVFSNLIKSLGDRPVWLPLSGGLDSRWILTMLLKLGYKNITTFSYGNEGHPEVKRAEIITKKLNVRWHSAKYVREETRRYYQSKDCQDYCRMADGLCSMPILNEYFALQLLRERKVIPDNAILINGQSGDYLTGGHIPAVVPTRQSFDFKTLAGEIIKKHYSLWLDLTTETNLNTVSQKILKNLELKEDVTFDQAEFAKYYELWEWKQRQSKYVVNGQRVYEWFGYDWRLPLWDDLFILFWQKIPWEFKFGQRLHKNYLNTTDTLNVFNGYLMGPHPLKFLERLAIYGLIGYAKIVGVNQKQLVKRYLNYFGNYATFYFQKNYGEYLKDSAQHRNPVSYWAKAHLQELGVN